MTSSVVPPVRGSTEVRLVAIVVAGDTFSGVGAVGSATWGADPRSRREYAALRGRGHGHARALGSVADRLLAVACAMLAAGTPFDPAHPSKLIDDNRVTP